MVKNSSRLEAVMARNLSRSKRLREESLYLV